MGLLDYSLAPMDAKPDDSLRVFFNMHISAKDAACTEAPEPGIDATVDAIVSDLVNDHRIDVTTPVDIEVGGLRGKWLDGRMAPATTWTCPFMTDGSLTVPLFVDDADYVTDHRYRRSRTATFWGADRDE